MRNILRQEGFSYFVEMLMAYDSQADIVANISSSFACVVVTGYKLSPVFFFPAINYRQCHRYR
jgi:hypothetical protein